VPTIGYGSTRTFGGHPVTLEHRSVSKEEATELLARDVQSVERAVGRLVTVELTQNMFDALVSFTYNLGSGNLQASTLRRKLNRGDVEGCADEFPKWRKSGGRITAGLVRRRAAERELFLT